MIEVLFSNKTTEIEIWKIHNGKVLDNKKFSLIDKEDTDFMAMLDTLKPQFLNSNFSMDSFDGKEHYVLKFRYQYYNQYYFENIEQFNKTRQAQFINYLKKLIYDKTKMEI